MRKPISYELILTPGEIRAIAEAIRTEEEVGLEPEEMESFCSAKDKVSALWEYAKAEEAAATAEEVYRETLENVRDAFKVDAL